MFGFCSGVETLTVVDVAGAEQQRDFQGGDAVWRKVGTVAGVVVAEREIDEGVLVGTFEEREQPCLTGPGLTNAVTIDCGGGWEDGVGAEVVMEGETELFEVILALGPAQLRVPAVRRAAGVPRGWR